MVANQVVEIKLMQHCGAKLCTTSESLTGGVSITAKFHTYS
jgi:hypothetical protein